MIISSCSSTSFKDIFGGEDDIKKRNDELMKDFSVNKDVLKKFQVDSAKTVVLSEQVDKENKPQLTPTSKKKSHNHKRTGTLPQKPTLMAKKKRKSIALQAYPEGFPEKLKGFDEKSALFWHKYKPFIFPGEKSILEVSYMGISTGSIIVETKENTLMDNREVYHIQTKLKTSSYYSYLYQVNDLGDSYLTKDEFLPLKFSLIQRQSSQDIDDLQLFDRQKLKAYSFYKRVTKDKEKKKQKEYSIPRFYQDPFSSLYFLRGLPMIIGKQYEIPIVNKGKVELLSATIKSKETLETKIGKKEAFKVLVHTKHSGETIKGGYMNFWFSADERRIFLKFDAKIKIGKVTGEITSYSK